MKRRKASAAASTPPPDVDVALEGGEPGVDPPVGRALGLERLDRSSARVRRCSAWARARAVRRAGGAGSAEGSGRGSSGLGASRASATARTIPRHRPGAPCDKVTPPSIGGCSCRVPRSSSPVPRADRVPARRAPGARQRRLGDRRFSNPEDGRASRRPGSHPRRRPRLGRVRRPARRLRLPAAPRDVPGWRPRLRHALRVNAEGTGLLLSALPEGRGRARDVDGVGVLPQGDPLHPFLETDPLGDANSPHAPTYSISRSRRRRSRARARASTTSPSSSRG